MTADACSRDGGSARELDYLYNEIDKLYHVYAHGCGVSDCAYWMLYDLEVAGGELPLAELTGVVVVQQADHQLGAQDLGRARAR